MDCSVTGTLSLANGQPAANVSLLIYDATSPDSVITSLPYEIRSNGSGVVSFTVPRSGTVNLWGKIDGFSRDPRAWQRVDVPNSALGQFKMVNRRPVIVAATAEQILTEEGQDLLTEEGQQIILE